MPKLIKADKVDSTNEWIKMHLRKLEDLDSVIAKTQTSGKGRNKKNWFSPVGGLWFSIFLEDLLRDRGALSQISSVVICEVLSEQGLKVNIKWPNDIILKGKKLGGILIEKFKGSFIVGIGLNLNLNNSDFPIPLKDKIITSKEVLHREIDIEAVARDIIKGIAARRDKLEEVHKKYLSLSGDINKRVKMISGKETFIGKVVTIQPDGGIKIRNESTEKVFYSGNLSYIRP